MVKLVDEILQELGWSSGFHVPVADEENQKLEAELERLVAARAANTQHLNMLKERFQTLESHMRHVEREQSEGQALLTTQRAQINSEEDQQKNGQLELNRLGQEMTEMIKKVKDIGERHTRVENDVGRTLAHLEDLKKSVSFDTDALRLWEDALLRSQEDNDLIKQFSQQDQSKAQEMELRRMKIREEVCLRRQTVQKMVGDVLSLEMAIERCQQMYNQAKTERGKLLEQWREAVAHLRQRHKDLHIINDEITALREALARKQEELEEQKTFYLNEVDNNKELERLVEQLNKEASKTRLEWQYMVKLIEDYQSELGIMKRELASMTNVLTQARTKTKKIMKDTEDKKKRVVQMITSNEELSNKLNKINSKSMTANDRAKELEKMVENNEATISLLNTEIGRLQSVVYRSQQSLKSLAEAETTQHMEIRGLKTSADLLDKHMKNVENDLQRQKEINYNYDFQIAQLQAKIGYLEGNTKGEEIEAQEEKIKDLTEILTAKRDVQNVLQAQVTRIQDDMRRTANVFTTDNLELLRLKDRLQNELLLVEGGKKQVKASQLRSQEKQVEENVLRLRVTQSQKLLDNMGDALYTLERHRLEMEAAMKERKVEVDVQKDLLGLKKRNLVEDKGKIRTEVQERLLRMEQHKKRYEIAVSLLGTDDDGTPLTATHFKIKNAQEKYMLQTEGDALDLKVRQAEREIIAMENTLKVVNATNNTFKRNLNAVEDEGPEKQEMQELENEHYEKLNIFRELRKQKETIVRKMDKTKILIGELRETKIEVDQDLIKTTSEANHLENELRSQYSKTHRAYRHLSKLLVEVRQEGCYFWEEKDIDIRGKQEINECVLQLLAELGMRHHSMAPTIERYVADYKITLPPSSRFQRIAKTVESVSSLSQCDSSQSRRSTATSYKSKTSSHESVTAALITLDFTVTQDDRQARIRRLSCFGGRRKSTSADRE